MYSAMYRFIKYSKIKFNEILVDKDLLDTCIKKSKDSYLSNMIIKNTTNYTLYKENYTKAYIMTFKNILIIHLKKSDNTFKDFEYLYNDSFYLFKVYETKTHYHIFCISKYSHNFSSLFTINFLTANDCDYKYSILYNIYNSFLVVNTGVNTFTNIHETTSDKYIFCKYLGKGSPVQSIEFSLNEIIKLINQNYMTYLPPHYMNI